MSLNTLVLPGIVVQQLYENALVQQPSGLAANNKSDKTEAAAILGKNQQHILIIANNKDVAFLPDDELNFLLGIIGACHLNMDDVGILNIAKNPTVDYNTLTTVFKAKKVLLFGATPESIQLPLSFPQYQLQQYSNQLYLHAPSLLNLRDNKEEKTKLWNALKKVFEI
ncbi:MAG: hypothetical protein RL172_2743 [Bacteroidota bacterium]|jgi:hypothetical protein